jgi:hypothetical protein
MPKKILLVLSIAAVGVVVACGKSDLPISPTSSGLGGNALADGSTLKINAPTPIAPTNGVQISRSAPFVVTFTNVNGRYANFPVTYELEIRNAATGAVVANNKFPAQSGANTSFTVPTEFTAFDTIHNWRVRATYKQGAQEGFGPWSATASFKSPLRAFLNRQASSAFDPLTEGFTVGQQVGDAGKFIPGVGWQAGATNSGIDYDIATCVSCRVEFDVTNVSEGEGQCCNADLKFLSMGDANAFGSFGAFRDHDWKMHLVQRADGDGTGLEIIWRNGGTDAGGGNPGDHRIKMTCCGPDFRDANVFHFIVDWSPSGYNISVGTNGGPQVAYLVDGFGGIPYAPPNHRISLGCYPRGETIPGAIYRNVSITPR